MKYVSIIVSIVVLLGGITLGYGKLQQKTENVIEDVKDVEVEVAKNEENIEELDKFSIQQTILMREALKIVERNTKLIEKLEK